MTEYIFPGYMPHYSNTPADFSNYRYPPEMAVGDLQMNNMRDQSERDDLQLTTRQTIHSGHFMVSRVHDVGNGDFDDEIPEKINESPFDFVTASKETSKTYSFGPSSDHTIAIDASLTKLFECMTLAYSGTITSPKWKAFRGMHLTVKDKIRLNNIIWREWHMQYIYHRHPIVCDFSTPLSDDIHSKPEAVVLEGKYWKRRLDTVTAEYKKWRQYFKERISREPPDPNSNMYDLLSIAELLERVRSTTVLPRSNQAAAATDILINNDFMEMDFTDNLFASLNTPFAFPNPKEFSQIGCADLIQPGLIQLQPNLDEFMDIDEIFGTKVPGSYGSSSSLEIPTSQSLNSGVINMPMSPLTPDYGLHSINNNNLLPLHQNLNTVDLSALLSTPSVMDNITQFSQNYQTNLRYTKSPEKNTVASYPVSQHSQSISQDIGVVSHDSPPSRSGRRGRHGNSQSSSTLTSSSSQAKRDGFAVPSNPVPRKQRSIAPAPSTSPTRGQQAMGQPVQQSTSPSVQSTYLAQLLTKGTYPGAMINVKSEPRQTGRTDTSNTLQGGASVSQKINVPQQQSTINFNTTTTNFSTVDFSKVTGEFCILPAGTQQSILSSNLQSSPDSSFSSFGSPVSSPQPINPASPISTYPLSPLSRDTLSPSTSPGLDDKGGPFNETRRAAHLSAEQKRRCNLKNGFDMLVQLVPSLAQNPKASKADMLRKTAEFCKKLKSERIQMQKEADILKQEMEALHNSISIIQSQLPETGAPVTRQRVDQMKEMFDEYVRNSTLQNWKFWVFSIIVAPLFDSYNNMVSTASVEDLCRTVLGWLDQHCSLQSLRPIVSKALVYISTTTNILSEPNRLRDQAIETVTKKRHQSNKHNR